MANHLEGRRRMSEKLFKFLLSELTKVRILCHNPTCGAVTELDMDQLDHFFPKTLHAMCPVCRQAVMSQEENYLGMLAAAVRGLKGKRDRVEIEFVIPDKE
jgi:hypothetical protein